MRNYLVKVPTRTFLPSDSFRPHMQCSFLNTSPLPVSHFTSFACIHLFCPRFIIIFATSPSRGQAADTKQVTAPLPAPAPTHHLYNSS
ncbi:hypothetical protein CMEL01_08353 [Colletotrichum melonis]|uniref:Uncharacterized protein n=1 Tax=Colletotrichum melonis TaxID=1209925 RepID=A0AAI9U005_9PEZI|nr:hypothetical protein CMEL01_08353 [Colletotrichum melonis]